MDTITHTLFGLTTYGAVNKERLPKGSKKALLFAAVVGSQIPDIDVVMNLTEVGRINEQMWHRGLTHSIFFVPIWSGLIYLLCALFWKVKDVLFIKLAFINILIHIFSDSLNTWGTGLLEPISPIRVSFGTLSIIDFMIWFIIITGFLLTKLKKSIKAYKVYRYVWLVIGLHVLIQGIQGYYFYQQASLNSEKVALRSEFIPWNFSIITKTNDNVELVSANLWSGIKTEQVLISNEDADLTPLFQRNPKAEVLMAWSPFVVIVDDEQKLGLYDPRFYENGKSFLYEYVSKDDLLK